MRDVIVEFLKMNDVKYKENVALSSLSYIKIGGIAHLVIFPNTEYKMISVIRFLGNHGIPYKILGRMSNVLPPDGEYSKIIIKTDLLNHYQIIGSIIEAQAGVSLPVISSVTENAELSGFEEISGIPGSVGGAVTGNAGAFGCEIGGLVSEVRVYDSLTDNIIDLSYHDATFSYRSSKIKDNGYVILSVRFKLCPLSKDLIKMKTHSYRNIRREKQPLIQPSLGSVFKRPGYGIYASKLIDDSELRGIRIGGAEISQKHAGFIINTGNATAKDYIELCKLIEETVYKNYNIKLEREVEFLE